jgi:tetratricopeptide (TPR) repeat protein
VSTTLWYLFELHTRSVEGERVFRAAAEGLRVRARQDTANQAALEAASYAMLAHAAYFSLRLGKIAAGYQDLTASAAKLRAGADPNAAIFVPWYLGVACWTLGRFDEANESLLASLRSSQVHGNRWRAAWALEMLGAVAHEQGAYEQAHGYLADALAAARQTGDRLLTAHVLYFFGRTVNRLGKHAQAERLMEEGLALSQQVRYPTGIGIAFYGLAMVAQARGDRQAASAHYEAGCAAFRESGDVRSLARVMTHHGLNAVALGDPIRASEILSSALRLAHECGSSPIMMEALAGLAAVRAQAGAWDPALELASLVLEHPASTQDAKNVVASVNAQLQTHLPSEQIETARQRARSIDLAEVVQRVLAGA